MSGESVDGVRGWQVHRRRSSNRARERKENLLNNEKKGEKGGHSGHSGQGNSRTHPEPGR